MGIGAAIFVLYFLISIARDNINAILESEVTAVEPTSYIQAVIGGSLFTVALVITVYFCFLINSYTLLIEKTKRSLESLLCTPISRFTIYALNKPLDLRPGASKQQLLDAMKGHILAQGQLTGTYQR